MDDNCTGRQPSATSKDTVDRYLAIDARGWQRDGVLKAGTTFVTTWTHLGASIGGHAQDDHVLISYQSQTEGGPRVDHRYTIRLDRTPCTYGGSRLWFLCPGSDCGRRIAILYLGPAAVFRCRHCLDLAYRTQRKDANVRAAWRAEKIRLALGWPPGVLSFLGWQKPKGMHWRTFNERKMQINVLLLKALTGLVSKLTGQPVK
jgi:hypothetical protein